jgi:ArsR family transcriptional regulator
LNTSSRGGKSRGVKAPVCSVPPIAIPEDMIRDFAEVFTMLGDTWRLKILLCLASTKELNVSELCERLGHPQSAVSHHLMLLRAARLVDYRRQGKHNFYRLTSNRLRDLLEKFFTDTANQLRQLHFDDFAISFKTT